jgi:hypothetical protein
VQPVRQQLTAHMTEDPAHEARLVADKKRVAFGVSA